MWSSANHLHLATTAGTDEDVASTGWNDPKERRQAGSREKKNKEGRKIRTMNFNQESFFQDKIDTKSCAKKKGGNTSSYLWSQHLTLRNRRSKTQLEDQSSKDRKR